MGLIQPIINKPIGLVGPIYNVPLVPTQYNDRLKCHSIMGLIRDNIWCICVLYNNLYVEGD